MKKYFFLTLIVASFLWSCDNRFGDLQGLNSPPVLTFGNAAHEIKDSLKTGINIKFKKQPISFSLLLTDPENHLQGISYSIQGSAKGTLTVNGTPVSGGFIPASITSTLSLTYLPDESNASIVLTFILTDNFGATSQAVMNLFVFDNLPPVAALSVVKNQLDGTYSAQFDASKSFDKDRSFGGTIQYYEYTVVGTNGAYPTITETTSSIPFVFPGPGGYTVTVKVYDNEGATATSQTNITF